MKVLGFGIVYSKPNKFDSDFNGGVPSTHLRKTKSLAGIHGGTDLLGVKA